MSSLRLRRSEPLAGRLRLPGDLHIGQEALLWAALGEGPSLVSGLSRRPDHAVLVAALRALGVAIADTEHGYRVAGVGLSGLRMPEGPLDARGSRTALEILVGLIAAQRFGTRVLTSRDLAELSVRTLVEPLRARGAHVQGQITADGDVVPPVAIAPLYGDEALSEAEIEIPNGDAATKLALLVSGLYVRGVTAISEGVLSRDHTERALVALGVPVQTLGGMTLLDTSAGTPAWPGFEWRVPGDFTLASQLMSLILSVPGSDVVLEGVALNRSRAAFFDVLRHAGARVDVLPQGDTAGNEPIGDVRVRASSLRGVGIAGELAQRMQSEVPALLGLVPALRGRIQLRDVASLRSHKPNVLKALANAARRFGAECTDYQDGFDLEPSRGLHGAVVSARELPELGLSCVALGLSVDGETRIEHAEALDALYPGIVSALRSLGAAIEEEAGS